MTDIELPSYLFEHLPPGYIEIRVIEDKKHGKVIERGWYRSPLELLNALPGLNALAKSTAAAVFMGVLPRRASGVGKTEDILPGLACWADLDFRDFLGGEGEARERLSALPLRPNFLIRSGHGLHAYWLMREPTESQVLSGLSRRLMCLLGADHAFDAARLLRLPGTWNRKDPDRPILVVIEAADPSLTYNPSDFEDHLPPDRDGDYESSCSDSIETGDTLSPRIAEILKNYPIVAGYFIGRGKLPRTGDGRATDTTSSGYDYSLVMALAKKGVTDEQELATALWCRPDGQAREKGMRYIARTVRAAMGALAKQVRKSLGKEPSLSDFSIDHVRVYNSDPPMFQLTVEGHTVSLTSKELLSAKVVRQRLFNVLRRVPSLPKQSEWDGTVNELMARAEVVEQPPEASDDEFLRDQIRAVVADLRVGEGVDDLDRGMALQHNRAIVFKTAAIHKGIREAYREVPSGEICSQLHAMGYVWITPKIDGKSVRVWTKPPDMTDTESEGLAT